MAALRASHKKAGHKVQTSEEKDKEALETCFAWIDGKSAKLKRTTLGDIKKKNKYIYATYKNHIPDFRGTEATDEVEIKKNTLSQKDKIKRVTPCKDKCVACKYVNCFVDNENKQTKRINAEHKIDHDIMKGREKLNVKEKEEKIERDPGRVITTEEYRRNKKDKSFEADTVWDDKSFTAVDEIKNWGELGEQIFKMWGEEIKFISRDSADKLKQLCIEFEDIWKPPDKPIKTNIKHRTNRRRYKNCPELLQNRSSGRGNNETTYCGMAKNGGN